MNVKDLVLNYEEKFEVVSSKDDLEKEIKNVYVGDLLSWVMGKAKEDSAWITIQGHTNIVAVALLINAACIIVAEGAEVTDEAIEKANKEEIIIIKTKLTHYDVAKIFFDEGI